MEERLFDLNISGQNPLRETKAGTTDRHLDAGTEAEATRVSWLLACTCDLISLFSNIT